MAERRMFSRRIISGDAFLDMPSIAQLFYFHLSMAADDDGFVDCARSVMRSVGASERDMNTLVEKGFVIYFKEEGISLIRHWQVSNTIRKDLYKETKYKNLKSRLSVDEGDEYILTEPLRSCNENVTSGKVRLDQGKEKKGEKETSEEKTKETDKVQEGSPLFLDSEFSETEGEALKTSVEAREGAREGALGSFHDEAPPDAAAAPSRQNAGVRESGGIPDQDFASWFEELRLYWNKLFPEKPYARAAANLPPGKREDLMGTWRTWRAGDCERAAEEYKKARDSPGLYDLKGCEYPSGLAGFLKNGVDAFAGEGALDRFLRKPKDAEKSEKDKFHAELARTYKRKETV
jgi:hypothetical protein